MGSGKLLEQTDKVPGRVGAIMNWDFSVTVIVFHNFCYGFDCRGKRAIGCVVGNLSWKSIALIVSLSLYFIFRFVVAGDTMLKAAMESSSGSYQYDKHLNINKTMVNTLNHLPFYHV